MRSRLLSAPTAFGRIGFASASKIGPKLIAILGIGSTSWTIPRASLYTFYAYGQGGQGQGAYFGRKQIRLTNVGTACACVIPRGFYGQGSGGNTDSRTLSLALPSLNLTIPFLGAPTGFDFTNWAGSGSNSSGGDGSTWGQVYSFITNNALTFATGPGAGYAGTNNGMAGHGEIRIVDEEPEA